MDEQTQNNQIPPMQPPNPPQDGVSQHTPMQQPFSPIDGIQPVRPQMRQAPIANQPRPIFRATQRPLLNQRPQQRPNVTPQSPQPSFTPPEQLQPQQSYSPPPPQSFPVPESIPQPNAQPQFAAQPMPQPTTQPFNSPGTQSPIAPQPQTPLHQPVSNQLPSTLQNQPPLVANLPKSFSPPSQQTIAERKSQKPLSKIAQIITRLRKNAVKTAIFIVVIVAAFQLFSWYSVHFNSKYKKLAITTYNHKGVSFTFNYPAVLQANKQIEGQLDNTPLAYTYNISDQDVVLVDATYIPIHKAMSSLKLSTDDVLSQIKANSGSYINYLYNTYPGSYNGIFKNCVPFTPNTNGSYLLCTYNGKAGTIAHVVGLDNNYQYGLNLFIPKSVYDVHQKIWQQVENSFSIQ